MEEELIFEEYNIKFTDKEFESMDSKKLSECKKILKKTLKKMKKIKKDKKNIFNNI